MSKFVTGLTFGGAAWTPAFTKAGVQAHCIGCGRCCYKVCPRDVLDLVERADVLDEAEIDEFEDLDDNKTMVMSIKNVADCIGCEACSRVCPKDCFTHSPLPAVA